MKKDYYYVYVHINKINNKKYFGITNNINIRWRGNGANYKTSLILVLYAKAK